MLRMSTVILMVILVVSTTLVSQTVGDYRTKASGNWSNAQIWERYNGSSWVAIATPPSGTETITVQSADSVFVNVPVSITDTLINQGIVEPLDSLTLTIGNGGTYKHDQDAGTIPSCIWADGSTLLLTGTVSTAPENRDQNYYNIIFNTTGQTSNLNMNLNNNVIGGDIRVINTGYNRWYLTSALANDTAIVTLLGDVYVEGGAFATQGTSNALTTFIVHHYGNIEVTGGNFSVSRGSQGGGTTTWYLYEGNFSMSDASSNNSTALAGGAKFVFAKDGGTQHLSLSNVTYNSNSIPFEVSSNTTLDVGLTPIEGTGIFILNEGATLATANDGGIAGSILTGGVITLSDSASYTFNGTNAQVTSAMMPDTVMNLTIDNPAGVTLSQPTTINGVLRLISGVFDNTIPFTLGPTASISYEGGSLLIPFAIEAAQANIPETFFVAQNYPNPFNPSTSIKFGLPASCEVTVTVFNLVGQEIATLFKGRMLAGKHELLFNATHLSSGIYLYRIQAGDNVSIRRMVLLK